MTSNAELAAAAPPVGHDQVQVLLVEDDDGDALLVGELLHEVGAAVAVRRAQSLTQAKGLVSGAACVLLDLGLPDSQGLNGLRQLLQLEPEAAIVVLTGQASEHLGEQAVRAGAQDYLVKGDVGGHMLLGGDFYDVVEASDSWVHALIGDVCGRGPAEAALGVCLRVAWRAMVLAGQAPAEVLSAVQLVLRHEQQDEAMFATVCMVSGAPDRCTGVLRLAGHPPPLLITPDGITELTVPTCPPPGLNDQESWTACAVELGDRWSLLLYTDGLIEGRIAKGPYRLGPDGLMGPGRGAPGAPPVGLGGGPAEAARPGHRPRRAPDGAVLGGGGGRRRARARPPG